MISGIQTALKNAIDVIAPPVTPLQDFTYHWKQLMNFYASHLTDCKAPIESTGIPRHLDKLLEILLIEEKDIDEPGVCLEYLLQHKLLDLLATLAGAETPPGMRLICLSFFRRLLTKSKHTLLHHASVYVPVQRLIAMCNGTVPSPIEHEEIQFLLTLCFLVCKYPYITNIVNDSSIVLKKNNSWHKGHSERVDLQRVTYKQKFQKNYSTAAVLSEFPKRKLVSANPLFEPLDAQAITIVNPNLFTSEQNRRRSMSFVEHGSSTKLNNLMDGILNRATTANGSEKRRHPRNTSIRSNISTRSNESFVDAEVMSQSSSPILHQVLLDSVTYPVTDMSQENAQQAVSLEVNNVPQETPLHLLVNNIGDLTLDTPYDVEENRASSNIKDSNQDDTKMMLETSQTTTHSKCLLLDSLKSYVNSADHTVRIHACEGIMVLASLEYISFANIIAHSDLAIVISDRLENLFNLIPAHVDPHEIEDIDVTWALDSPLLAHDKKFPGCRRVASFFMWLDYCDQLIKESNPRVGDVIAKCIRKQFFEKVLTPVLSSHHAVLVTALITKCLKEITSLSLSTEMSYWLVGQHRDLDEIPDVWSWCVLQKLIDNCYTDSDDLTLETLKLFEEVIERRDEHILHCLVLTYLTTRGYYDNSAADSAIASWSDEEDEREREKKSMLDLSQGHHHSRTLAPSNIHRIINCFLSLVPRQLQTDSDINNYERYMADWEKQYSTVLRDCALFAWPLEAVSIDDSASSDSRPEADHCSTRFYMGPFLSMLLDKITNIPRQKYDINLQLTIVMSKLCLLPHPYLHEFLLNPLISLAPGKKSLFICLQRVVKQLVNQVQKITNYKEMLKETRQKLLEDCFQDSSEENILYESVIITEEFCKELAAIAYVKYHHSM